MLLQRHDRIGQGSAYNGGSALHPHILFEDVFIGSGYLDHVCERDDRFAYCDRIHYILTRYACNLADLIF